MPTYQYACSDCDHAFEQVQSFTDDSLTVCPQCQGRLRKIYNAVGVVFKGSGFYRTDSRADSAKSSSAGGETKAEPKSGSTSESTGGSKSEPKSTSPTPAKSEAGAA